MVRSSRAGCFLALGLALACGETERTFGRTDTPVGGTAATGGCKSPKSAFEGVMATLPRMPNGATTWKSIQVDCDVVLWNNSTTVQSVDIETRTTRVLYSDPDCPSIYGVGFDAEHLYVGGCVGSDPSRGGLLSVSRSTLEISALSSAVTLDVARLGEDVFAVGCGQGVARFGPSGMSSIPVPDSLCLFGILAAGTAVIPFDDAAWHFDVTSGNLSSLGMGLALATDGRHVLMATGQSLVGEVKLEAISLSDGARTKLVGRPQQGNFAATIAGSSVYYTWTSAGGEGEVGLVPLAGGEVRLLARGPWLGAIAADDYAIYWDSQVDDMAQLHRALR